MTSVSLLALDPTGNTRRAPRTQDTARRLVLFGAIAILVVLIVLPLVMLLYGSFRTAPPGQGGTWTLQHYAFLTTRQFGTLVWRSTFIGAGATALAMAIGGTMAIVMVRLRLPAANVLETLVLIPGYLTPFVGAVAWITLLSPNIGYLNAAFRYLGLPTLDIYSYGGIIWVMGLYFAPVAYLFLRPALGGIDRSLEESARVAGATSFTVLTRIVVPLITPAVFSCILVIFVMALGDFGIPGVLGSRDRIEVIPTALVRMVTKFPSDPNGASVLGIFLTVVTVAGLAVNNRLLAKRDYTTIGGKGMRAETASGGLLRIAGLTFILVYLVVALILPIAVMALTSFQAFPNVDVFKAIYTLDNYRFVFSFPSIQRAILNSIILALATAGLGTLLAAVLAYFIVRKAGFLAKMADLLGTSTVAIPHTVLALGLIWFWVVLPVSIYGTIWIILFAYLAAFLPYALRTAVSAFMQVDKVLEEAGRIFGASWLMVMRRILVPLVAPGLLSGAIMVIYYSFRELGASLMLYTSGSEVLATAFWEVFGEGRFTQLYALAMINVVIVMVLVGIANLIGRQSTT